MQKNQIIDSEESETPEVRCEGNLTLIHFNVPTKTKKEEIFLMRPKQKYKFVRLIKIAETYHLVLRKEVFFLFFSFTASWSEEQTYKIPLGYNKYDILSPGDILETGLNEMNELKISSIWATTLSIKKSMNLI